MHKPRNRDSYWPMGSPRQNKRGKEEEVFRSFLKRGKRIPPSGRWPTLVAEAVVTRRFSNVRVSVKIVRVFERSFVRSFVACAMM